MSELTLRPLTPHECRYLEHLLSGVDLDAGYRAGVAQENVRRALPQVQGCELAIGDVINMGFLAGGMFQVTGLGGGWLQVRPYRNNAAQGLVRNMPADHSYTKVCTD